MYLYIVENNVSGHILYAHVVGSEDLWNYMYLYRLFFEGSNTRAFKTMINIQITTRVLKLHERYEILYMYM